ncbi:hypothetical protein FQN50_005373 [Emmonsiellopsis sp. PD_5]|nr:hypothetical protein FQN50_005373 [Emmonsiellopsis sp. PD_5]
MGDIHFPMQTTTILGQPFEPSQVAVHRYSTSACIQPLYELHTPNLPRHNGNNSHTTIPRDDLTMNSRSIFIQNLTSDTTWQHLKDYLRTAGTVERCDIPEDRKGGGRRARGYATATFRTKEEAQRAIKFFDNSCFRGSKIRVRFDRDNGGSSSGSGNGGHTVSINRNGAVPASTGSKTMNGNAASASTTPRTNGNTSGTGSEHDSKPATPSTDEKTSTVITTTVVPKSPDLDSSKRSEPLVVNGSRVGLKAGRASCEKVGCEG